jgi:molybdopterin-containing oxidoreductase family membrane subunit
MLEKALTGTRTYWSWIFALLLVIGGGVACWFWQFNEGLTITGLSRDVVWGFYIAQFTFLVGVAASAVMVVLPYYLHDYKAFGKMTILGEFLAIPAVIMCMAFIFVDMGMPNRILNMILHPSPRSMMFWDGIALGGYLVLNIIISHWTMSSERREEPPPKWLKPIILLSIPWAVSIHTVTAFLYSGLAGRPFWLTAILAPRFLASAFAAGPAILLLLAFFVRRISTFDPGKQAIDTLAKIVTYAMTINVFFVLMELFTALYSDIPEHVHHFQFLFMGLEGENTLAPWMLNPGDRVTDRSHQSQDTRQLRLAEIRLRRGCDVAVDRQRPGHGHRRLRAESPRQGRPLCADRAGAHDQPRDLRHWCPDSHRPLQDCARGEGAAQKSMIDVIVRIAPTRRAACRGGGFS